MNSLNIAKALFHDALKLRGEVYRHLGDFNNAVRDSAHLCRLTRSSGDAAGYIDARLAIANLYNLMGLKTRAAAYAKRAIPYAKRSDLKLSLALAYAVLGSSLRNLENRRKDALQYYLKALDIYKGTSEADSLCVMHCNAAILYKELNEDGKCMEHLNETLKIAVRNRLLVHIANVKNELGTFYARNGQHGPAERAYKESLKIKTSVGDNNGLAMSLNNLGQLYIRTGENIKSLRCLKKAYETVLPTGNLFGLYVCARNLGNAYGRAGKSGKAVCFLKIALRNAVAVDYSPGIALCKEEIAALKR